jgi:hypothetical protein
MARPVQNAQGAGFVILHFKGPARLSLDGSGGARLAWLDPGAVADVEAVIAYCEYVYGRYGRFPTYAPPSEPCSVFLKIRHAGGAGR